jgi:B-box zinc finger
MCDYCEEEVAASYCQTDAAHFCSKCDVLCHNNKITARHVRTSVGEGSSVFGNCRIHAEKAIEYFCSQCHVPVCVVCKMVGNHANGEASRHQLVNVVEAYQTVLEEAKQVSMV